MKNDIDPLEYPTGLSIDGWGKRLDQLIKERGEINTQAVAEGAKTSPTSINRWRAESSDITLSNAANLATYLEVDPGVLYFGRRPANWVEDDAAVKNDPITAVRAIYRQIAQLSKRAEFIAENYLKE